jgi:hypothetical protein
MTQAAEPRAARWQIPFFTIWTGQSLSLFGSRIAMFALIWWLTATTGSATVLALATLFATLPLVFLGPVAGVLIDRWNRRAVMIVSDGLIAILSLWIAVLFWTGAIQVWHVYLLMLAREIGGTFHWPAMQTTTALMVPQQHLARVNGVNQAMYGGLNILGPAVGALLLRPHPGSNTCSGRHHRPAGDRAATLRRRAPAAAQNVRRGPGLGMGRPDSRATLPAGLARATADGRDRDAVQPRPDPDHELAADPGHSALWPRGGRTGRDGIGLRDRRADRGVCCWGCGAASGGVS